MAHDKQLFFFAKVFSRLGVDSPKHSVIDIGSLDINGGPHALLKNCHKYLGVDIGSGPNVQLVCRAELIDLPTGSFSIAMSSECWEHNPHWMESHFQMCRLTQPGGLVVWSCAGIGREVHGTLESDGQMSAPLLRGEFASYYSNVSAGKARKFLNLDYWFQDYLSLNELNHRDTYFVGIRKGSDNFSTSDFAALKKELSDYCRPDARWKRVRDILDLHFHYLLPVYVWIELNFRKVKSSMFKNSKT